MKKFMLLVAIVLAIILAGCRSVEVTNHGQDYVRHSDGSPVLVNGEPVVFSKGWSVEHFQHWMATKADSLKAKIKPDAIEFALNGLNSDPDGEDLEKAVKASGNSAGQVIGAAAAASAGL